MRLALLGGGGHCRSCIEVIRSAGLEIAGILTPDLDSGVPDCPRLGDDGWLDTPGATALHYLVAVGQVGVSPLRSRLFARLRERGLRLATVQAATAVVSGHASIGAGSIVMHQAVVNFGAVVGENCIVNTAAIVEHDAIVGEHCHIATRAVVNGGARIGAGTMIGSAAVVLQGVSIAPGVVVGAGAVVTRNIDTPGTWVGMPARRLE